MIFDKEYFRLYAQKQRNKAIALLGGCCAKCGATESLEFDHVDSSTKSFHLNRRLASLKSPGVIAELKKCQLLCEKCHQEKTLAERAKALHGSMQSWMHHKCKCSICLTARGVWYDKRNAARRCGSARGPYKNRGVSPIGSRQLS